MVLLYMHASRDSWLSSITLHLICLALHFLQIIRYTYTITKMLNKANATSHVDVCIPLVSTFCLVTLYLINCYLIMYHQSSPKLHYPLFLPILFDLYLLFAKCRIMATLMKKILCWNSWVILPWHGEGHYKAGVNC